MVGIYFASIGEYIIYLPLIVSDDTASLVIGSQSIGNGCSYRLYFVQVLLSFLQYQQSFQPIAEEAVSIQTLIVTKGGFLCIFLEFARIDIPVGMDIFC